MVRVGAAAAAAGIAGGAVGLGAFDPEPDMVGDVRNGDGGFGGEIDRNLPVGVVSEECGTVSCFDFFERLSKVMSEPLGWS